MVTDSEIREQQCKEGAEKKHKNTDRDILSPVKRGAISSEKRVHHGERRIGERTRSQKGAKSIVTRRTNDDDDGLPEPATDERTAVDPP